MEGIKRSVLSLRCRIETMIRQKAKVQRSHIGDKFRNHQNRSWMRSLRKKCRLKEVPGLNPGALQLLKVRKRIQQLKVKRTRQWCRKKIIKNVVFWKSNELSVSSRKVITMSFFSGNLGQMKSQNQLEDVALWRSLVTWARVASVEGMVGMNVRLIGMGSRENARRRSGENGIKSVCFFFRNFALRKQRVIQLGQLDRDVQ